MPRDVWVSYPSKMNRLKLQTRRLERGGDSQEAGNFFRHVAIPEPSKRRIPWSATRLLPWGCRSQWLNHDVFVDTLVL